MRVKKGETYSREDRKCLYCKTEFNCFKSSTKKFCCVRCSSKYQWENNREIIYNAILNKPEMKDSTKEKIKKANIGKKYSVETNSKKGLKKEKHPNWQGGITQKEFECDLCGCKIIRQGNSNTKQHFCKNCINDAYLGERSPVYNGAIAHWKNYPVGWNKRLKENIRSRDDFTCQICGIVQEETGRMLDVHHIDKNKDNLNEDNLISLCSSCHHLLHQNIEIEEELLCQVD